MEKQKKYCLVIENEEGGNHNAEIEKNCILELTDIINSLDFDKIGRIKIFRSDNL